MVRCGFLHSYFTGKQTDDQKRIEDAVSLEMMAFTKADLGIVTSSFQRDIVLKEYGLNPDKIKVIPNHVLTDVFKPSGSMGKKYDLVFVGRGDKQKNLLNLLEALRILKSRDKDISLLLVGGCCNEDQIRDYVKSTGLEVTFKANVPNIELPDLLNQAHAFILPSLYEGHPKALLEAMSCGVACIGTNVPGINDQLVHLKTGYLCETDPESLAKAVETVLMDKDLRNRLGSEARKHVVQNFDIERILKLELDAIQELLAG